MPTRIFVFLAIITLSTSLAVKNISLNANWTVKVLSSSNTPQSKYPADIINKQFETSVPTTIHLDLLTHKQIEDPFYRDNYPKLEWVSRSAVMYSKIFTIPEQYRQTDKAIEIIFHGIDTYSNIVLNGVEILKTENAFRKYTKRIEDIIKEENILQITIDPTHIYDDKQNQLNAMPFKYAHTRKACYQYSWDWAPYTNTLGIWKDVEIRIFEEISFDYIWARNKRISEGYAIINFAARLNINTFKDDKLSSGYKMAIFLSGQKLSEKEVNINQKTVYADVQILQPKFWWPNGFGEPYIYDFEVKIIKDQNFIDMRKVPYGIRTAQLDLANKNFNLKINNYSVYCKGANYVPPDMFYTRLTNPSYNSQKNTFERLLNDAVESNFNMIRIWGGGQYESDEFLEMASRKGIMIFYDFMFSDSIYPSTEKFLANVEEEVKQQVRRARNYPAVVLWCGNNQILQGIEQWGWGAQNYQKDYKTLFEILIPRILQIEHPQISYIPSSPIYGVGNGQFNKGGDFHYWGVWAGGMNFQSYRQAVGPFNSQFGTQGLPVWHTIKQFTQEEDRKYQSPIFLIHERHGSQFRQLKSYMSLYMNPSKNFEMEAYLSGVLQAYAIEIAIIAQRLAKPKSSGTLYWQMNDAWPGISWSSIDYYGRWKALQYAAKRLYPNIATFFELKTNNVFAINDNLYRIQGKIQIKVMKFNGEVLQEKQVNANIEMNTVEKIHQISPVQQDKNSTLVYCQIWYKDQLIMSHTSYFVKPKELVLPAATLNVEYDEQTNQISLSSTVLIKNLFIDHETQYIKLSDNYFDLVPNIPVAVTVQGQLSDLIQGLKYVSMREASEQGELNVKINGK